MRTEGQRESAENICLHNKYGEWFLIYKLGQNMDAVTFGDLVDDLDQAFRKWDTHKIPDEEVALDAPPPSAAHSPIHVNTDLLYAWHSKKDNGDDKTPKKKSTVVNVEAGPSGTRQTRRDLVLWEEEFTYQSI